MNSNDVFSNVMNYTSSYHKSERKIKKSDALLENIKKLGFNMSQLEGVIRTKGNQLIISIAGSGKTTALIFKVAYDIVTGEATKVVSVNGNDLRVLDKIWVCTFLNSGSKELKTKLSSWQRRLGVMDTSDAMSFSTLHAEFKRALTSLGVPTNIIDSSVNRKNLKTILGKYGITYNGKPLVSDMLQDLEGALTYTRNRLDDERYKRDIYAELGIGPSIVDLILREWKQIRKELGVVDFEDLQEILYEECCVKGNEEIIDFISNKYKYIYIDEFQDTSQIQYAILKVYARNTNKIVAIGDDDQTIYSWRGSYNKIITEEFAKDFSPTISNLNVNYRCPSNILRAIRPSLELNKFRFKKELNSHREGGELNVIKYEDYESMASSISELICNDIKRGKSVAILCRVNSDGLLPALMLDLSGKFEYTISSDGMTLDSYIGNQVINIAKLFTERSTPAVRSVLGMLTWNTYSVNNLMRVCKSNRESFWNISDNDLSYSCPDIAETLKMWKGIRSKYGDIEALRVIYFYFRTNVFVSNTQYNEVCRNVIYTMETLLSFTKSKTVEDFLDEVEDINERLKARIKGKRFSNNVVKIATVHEFKGKEADSVYIWNDSVDVFPHKSVDISIEEELEEERRVHYIACTRAREKNTILTINGREGQFLKEMDLSKANVQIIKDKEKQISGVLSPNNKDISEKELLDDEFVIE